jgi:hypothetical protein
MNTTRRIGKVLITLAAVAVVTGMLAGEAAAAKRSIFYKPLSSGDGLEQVREMVEFGGKLYIAAGRSDPRTMRLYRLESAGCKVWDDVTPTWIEDPYPGRFAMEVFGNFLYVGDSEGEIYRTADGNKWSRVTGNLSGWSTSILEMRAFAGHLYVVVNFTEIWRSAYGTSWEVVVGPPPALHTYGFGQPLANDISSLEVFDGKLWAGLGKDNMNGIDIWCTSNGRNWSLFHTESAPGPGHVHAMEVFNGYLYIGEYHGDAVFRTNGASGNWQRIPVTVAGDVIALQAHAGKLYLAAHNMFGDLQGYPLLYSTTDGTNWAPVANFPLGREYLNGIRCLLSYAGRLFMGTHDSVRGARVAEMGSNLPQCMIWACQDGIETILKKWLWNLKSMLEYYKIQLRTTGEDSSTNLVDDFTRALERLDLAPEAEELRQLARTSLEAAHEHIEAALYLERVARETIDPGQRTSIVTAAIEQVEEALARVRDCSFILSLIQEAPAALRFHDGFEEGTGGWVTIGSMVAYPFFGEPSMLSYGGGAAAADVEMVESPVLVSFRVVPYLGRAMGYIGRAGEESLFVGVEFGRVSIVREIEGIFETIEEVEVPLMDDLEWQTIQVERRIGSVRVLVNGFERIFLPFEEPILVFPGLVADPASIIVFDDFEIVKLH